MERVALDIETTGLTFTTDSVQLVVQNDGDEAMFIETPGSLPPLRNDLEYILHNSSFDLPFLDYHYHTGFPKHVFDTLIAERLLTAGLDVSRDLKTVAKKYLDVDLDKTLQTSFDGGELSEEQYVYARQDTDVLFGIRKAQLRRIRELNLDTIWDIEKAVTPIFAKMIRYGVRLDADALRELITSLTLEYDKLKEELEVLLTPYVKDLREQKYLDAEAKLDEYLRQLRHATEAFELGWHDFIRFSRTDAFSTTDEMRVSWTDESIDRKDGKPKGQKRYVKWSLSQWRKEHPRPPKVTYDQSPINLNSSSQLLEALNKAGILVTDTSSSMLRRVLTEVTDEQRDTILLPLIDYKKRSKLLSAFGDSLLDLVDEHGYVHPGFNQLGTASGRPSCSSPNILQIPNKGGFRKLFKPDPGHVAIVCDFSGMEMRIVAELSGDPFLMEAFQKGEDVHGKMTARIFETDNFTDDQRKVGKMANFLFLYGGEANKLHQQAASMGFPMTKEKAVEIIKRQRETIPTAHGWIRRNQLQAVKKGYVSSALGRRRWFDIENTFRGEIERAAGNHVIQSTNADITKLAMVAIDKLLAPIGGRIMLQVYDEIDCSVPEEHAAYAAEVVKSAMEQAARVVLKRVPVAVDCHICRSWDEEDVVESLEEAA